MKGKDLLLHIDNDDNLFIRINEIEYDINLEFITNKDRKVIRILLKPDYNEVIK